MGKIKLNVWLWGLIPLLSGVGFLALELSFASHVGLDAFDWQVVQKNLLSSATNATQLANVSVTPVSISGQPNQTVQPASAGQTHGGFQASAGQANPAAGVATNTPALPGVTAVPADRLTRELKIRMLWAVSAVCFAGLCFVVVGYSIQIIAGVFKLKAKPVVSLICAGIVAFILLWYFYGQPMLQASGGSATEELFQIIGTTNTSNVPPVVQSLRAGQMPLLASFRHLVGFLATASQVGFIFLVLGAGAVLMAMRTEQDAFAAIAAPTPDDIARAKELYERRVDMTITLLQLTASALVAGIAEVFLLYNLAGFHVVPTLQGDIQYFAQGMATTAGLIYSALLVAIYLPLVAGQKSIGREMLASHGGNKVTGGQTVFLAQLDDVNPSKAPMVKAILTVLSPLLAAFLAKLVASLTEYF